MDEEDIAGHLKRRFGYVDLNLFHITVTRGEILSDSRGIGSLQRMVDS